MPCIKIPRGYGMPYGFVCVPNDPVAVEYGGKTYRFEWTEASGWIPLNRDGSQRLTPVPRGAWKALEAADAAGGV